MSLKYEPSTDPSLAISALLQGLTSSPSDGLETEGQEAPSKQTLDVDGGAKP